MSAHSRRHSVRIVALGGGTGLSMLLRGLKGHMVPPKGPGRPQISGIVAVVTVTDDGGSSGRLRREYSILPPGDIRNCLVALSRDEALLGKIFQYRFPTGRGLAGHSFGNLFLAALTNVTGDFPEAVRFSGQVLAIRGRIFPSTTSNVTLRAVLEDGSIVDGETRISRSRKPIRRVELVPRNAHPLGEVLQAIREADLIVVGPGSLYTSLIPNLLVRGISEAIRRSHAQRVYIANLMTQPGETDGYTVADHLRAIYQHSYENLFDSVVLNHRTAPPRVLARYRAQGAEPVASSLQDLRQLGVECITSDLLHRGGVVRHDQGRLAKLLLDCGAKRAKQRR